VSELSRKFDEYAHGGEITIPQRDMIPKTAELMADRMGLPEFTVPREAIEHNGNELGVNITPVLRALDLPGAGKLYGSVLKFDEEVLLHAPDIHVIVRGNVEVIADDTRDYSNGPIVENSADVLLQVVKPRGHEDTLNVAIDNAPDWKPPVPEISKQMSFKDFSLSEDVNTEELTVTELLPHHEGALNLGKLASDVWKHDAADKGLIRAL